MSRNSTPASAPKSETKPAVEATDTKSKTVKPLYAVHEINPFGKGNHATANSVFVPVSEDERNELLGLEAARELTEDELVVFDAKQAAMAKNPAAAIPAADAPDPDVIS